MAEVPKIEIDMDKECSRCEAKGVTDSGLCLTCIGQMAMEEAIEEEQIEEEDLEKPIYSSELIQFDFTKEEKIELGLEVAEKLGSLRRIESQKKSAAAGFAASEKQMALELDELSRKIEDGFEMRRENCIVSYDDNLHMVYVVLEHDKSGFIIKQRKMTSSEMQRSLPEF